MAVAMQMNKRRRVTAAPSREKQTARHSNATTELLSRGRWSIENHR